MAIEIVKIERVRSSFRIVLPKKLITLMCWQDVSHVMVERQSNNTLILRRFIDAQALKGSDESDQA